MFYFSRKNGKCLNAFKFVFVRLASVVKREAFLEIGQEIKKESEGGGKSERERWREREWRRERKSG